MASSSSEINPSASEARFSYKDASHEEVLEDLSSRFILNLPDEELASLERICFQVEQAHWFYEDFIREQNPSFPSLPLKKFSAMLFHACPLLQKWSGDHENAFSSFMQYKIRVPVCGAIMLNGSWDKCVLVKGWKSSSGWGFPKGKINEDEPKHTCAIREVLEETGYNLIGKLKPEDVIELSIKEQRISLFIVSGVEEDFPFQTKTRKEISRIEWFRLADLPTWRRNKQVPGKFYLISPFIGPLKMFINAHKPRNSRRAGRQKKNKKMTSQGNAYASDALVTDADTDVIQESDSQTSDNQAERPETVPSTNETSTDFSKGILGSDNMDPHFARLLNSLTLSATGNVPQTLKTAHLPTDSTTPIPNSVCNIDPDIVSEEKYQGHQKVKTPNLSAMLSQDLARDSSNTPIAAPNGSSPFSSGHLPTGSHEPSYSPRQARSYNVSGSVTNPPSYCPIRTDISPYLTKSSVDITSTTRRLQQLALLERVADESAKMLPQVQGATALGPTPSILDTYSSSHTSIPSHGIPFSGVFYSTPARQLPSSTVQIPYNLSRSHPNQAVYDGTSQVVNNHIMNHFHPAPLNLPSFERPASNFGVRPHSYVHDCNPTSPLPTPSTQPRDSFPLGVSLSGLNRFASATPAVDSFPSRGIPASTAQTLLSILNGNQLSQSNPAVPLPANRPI